VGTVNTRFYRGVNPDQTLSGSPDCVGSGSQVAQPISIKFDSDNAIGNCCFLRFFVTNNILNLVFF
jgi:hypothetical protein